ncbi:MAG: helix-hairpin-helix domain-containing protein [Bacteroidota bacterium]
MFFRFLFTRSELRGTLILTAGAILTRLLLFAAGPYEDLAAGTTGSSETLAEPQAAKKQPVKIEINSADSVRLLDLNGIGPFFAGRIIKYRTALGGFANPDQLREVYGMDSVRFKGFIGQIRIDTGHLRKMDVNRATFKELLAHPYLEYEQVKALCRFRDRRGILSSPGEIWAAGVLADSLWDKLSPYLFAGKDSVQKVRTGFVK